MKKINSVLEKYQALTKVQMQKILGGSQDTCICGLQSPCVEGTGDSAGYVYSSKDLCLNWDETDRDYACDQKAGGSISNGCTCSNNCGNE